MTHTHTHRSNYINVTKYVLLLLWRLPFCESANLSISTFTLISRSDDFQLFFTFCEKEMFNLIEWRWNLLTQIVWWYNRSNDRWNDREVPLHNCDSRLVSVAASGIQTWQVIWIRLQCRAHDMTIPPIEVPNIQLILLLNKERGRGQAVINIKFFIISYYKVTWRKTIQSTICNDILSVL